MQNAKKDQMSTRVRFQPDSWNFLKRHTHKKGISIPAYIRELIGNEKLKHEEVTKTNFS
jgi:hypothetical protein